MTTVSHMSLDTFTRAYIECALWSTNDESTPDGGVPLDRSYDVRDIAPATLARMVSDCELFQRECADDLAEGDDEQAGHDFWLTRNGHGAGFWDGDWPEPAATRLTDMSHGFSAIDLYVGDDGQIHA